MPGRWVTSTCALNTGMPSMLPSAHTAPSPSPGGSVVDAVPVGEGVVGDELVSLDVLRPGVRDDVGGEPWRRGLVGPAGRVHEVADVLLVERRRRGPRPELLARP